MEWIAGLCIDRVSRYTAHFVWNKCSDAERLGEDAVGAGELSSKSVVQSAAKVFAVLQAFTVDGPELTITDIANRIETDRGTAFRLTHTLVSLGYLAGVPDSRRFRLTLKCLQFGYVALAAGGLKTQSKPLLREVVPDLADAASLGMLEGPDVVYLERAQTEMQRHDLQRRPGSRTGAYASALGHAILAWMPEDEARAVLASSERVKLSDRTLTDLPALCDRLAEVRARGYAIADGENAYGLRTIAAPVLQPGGSARAGVSLTVRSERMALDAFVDLAIPSLLRISGALTDALRMTDAAA